MHSWSVKFRVTPAGGGSAYEVSFSDLPVVCQPRQVPIVTEHEMLNREVRTTRHGVRMFVDLVYEFESNAAGEADLVNLILNPHVQDDAVIEISLDSGTTYREAVLTDGSPTPEGRIDDKTIGSIYAMTWACVQPRPAYVVVGAGGWA